MKTRRVYKGRKKVGRHTKRLSNIRRRSRHTKRKLIKGGGKTPTTYSNALNTAKNNYRLAKLNEKQQKEQFDREKKLAKFNEKQQKEQFDREKKLAKFNKNQQKEQFDREKKLAKICNKININVDPKNLTKKERKILDQCITRNIINNKPTQNKSSGTYGFNDDITPASTTPDSFVYYGKLNPDMNMFNNSYGETSF